MGNKRTSRCELSGEDGIRGVVFLSRVVEKRNNRLLDPREDRWEWGRGSDADLELGINRILRPVVAFPRQMLRGGRLRGLHY